MAKRDEMPRRGTQGAKDSDSKRVNFDNTRAAKFKKDMKQSGKQRQNPRRPKRNGKDEADDEKRSRAKDCRSNDISWYSRNGEMMKAATNTNFITTTGARPMINNKVAVPGVMAIRWSPVFGSEDNDPLNQAANSTYSFIVHANSRNYQYNANDLMVMILAGFNVFAAISLGLRAYGTMRKFEGQDMYTPDALVTAMGFNYTDLQHNLSQMWFDLNEVIARVKQIWVPTTMPVLDRWFWMSANIYRDGDSVKSQYYMFVPYQFYCYTPGTQQNPGSSLQPQQWGENNTWESYMTTLNTLISALLHSEDRGMIYGDILNAYGADKIFALNPISADYTVEPTYDREVLTQIENLNICRMAPGAVIQDQVSGALLQQWPLTTASNYSSLMVAPSVQVLNFHQKEAPTNEQIMIATRLKVGSGYTVTYTGGDAPAFQLAPWTYGTEIVRTVDIFQYNWNSGAPVLDKYNVGGTLLSSTGSTFNARQVGVWSAFDWAPWIYQIGTVVTPNAAYMKVSGNVIDAIGDYDNYAYITDVELKKMNNSAVYSEFGVPTL